MTTQVQHAHRIVTVVDSYMRGKTPRHGSAHFVYQLTSKYGWATLGSGNFGFAIQHPENPDLAIKVVLGCDAYNPYTGRKLHLADGYMDYVATVMAAPKSKHLPEYHAAIVGEYCAVVVMRKYRPSDDAGYVAQEAFQEIIRDISDPGLDFVKAKLGRFTDCHAGNFMWDKDTDTFVITDPYAARTDRNKVVERWIGKDGVVTVDVSFNPERVTKIEVAPVKVDWDNEKKAWVRVAQKGPNIQNMPRDDVAARQARNVMLQMANAFMMPEHLFNPGPIRVRVEKARHMHGAAADFMIFDSIAAKDKRAFIDRTPLAEHSEKPTLRRQEKDHVLRLKSEHDCGARIEGVQSVLFSKPRPWWLRRPWRSKSGRPHEEEGRECRARDLPLVRTAI